MKETWKWKLLNSIILINKMTKVGNEFENNCERFTGDENIADVFNHFLVNVGPPLVDNIPADTHFSQ